MSTLKETANRAARAPAEPILRFANKRFEDLHEHLDNRMDEVQARLDESVAVTRELKRELETDVQVIAELTITLQRFAERFGERVDDVLAALEHAAGSGAERGKE